MRTRLDVDDYQTATADQRAEADAYFAAIGLPLEVSNVIAAEATAEGTVRVERYPSTGIGRGAVLYIASVCTSGRCCCGVDRATGPCTHYDYVTVHETLRPALPPPWLAWPDTEEGDTDAG